MSNDTTIPFHNPAFRDEMTDLIRAHAQTAIRQAILAELAAFLGEHDDTDSQGRRNVVRNGYHPEREILTGVGRVAVQLPKTRDRASLGRCFRSLILPPPFCQRDWRGHEMVYLWAGGIYINARAADRRCVLVSSDTHLYALRRHVPLRTHGVNFSGFDQSSLLNFGGLPESAPGPGGGSSGP